MMKNSFSIQHSPRRLGFLSRRYLSGQNQKNQDRLMQHTKPLPLPTYPVMAMLIFHFVGLSIIWKSLLIRKRLNLNNSILDF